MVHPAGNFKPALRNATALARSGDIGWDMVPDETQVQMAAMNPGQKVTADADTVARADTPAKADTVERLEKGTGPSKPAQTPASGKPDGQQWQATHPNPGECAEGA